MIDWSSAAPCPAIIDLRDLWDILFTKGSKRAYSFGSVFQSGGCCSAAKRPLPAKSSRSQSLGLAASGRRVTGPELTQDQAKPVIRDEDTAPTTKAIDRHW